ncbi:MAG TPA: outer membrane protein assembly factor BamE [Steroidobacteraceae bacterium]|nr:outer membrane protein assembly factor BamE [Steroidobacteraceae bacterium]
MNPPSMTAIARAALLLTSLLGTALATGGCVYRPNIQQGNLLEVEDVEKVELGMTRSQVRYLLGTPMLADPFDPQRWDYVFTFRRGRETKIDRSHFVVHFDGDKVSKVEKLDLPDGANDPKKKRKQASAEPTREPPAAPSISQPQPDAPRPGGNDG